ncbi:hypothetical protein RUM43_006838 [Polyplax serrata]|uniref:Uncharacterized protein n=1 Tax=Polyplax serrata TaxID=468196 RepID=A0AAN8PLV8_POLSC
MCDNVVDVINNTEPLELRRLKIDTQDDACVEALKEIEKMDSLLVMKTTEKDEAKLSRQQVEKESLEVLQNLIHCGIPKAIESNLKAFEKLINDMTEEDKNRTTINIGEPEKNKKCAIPTSKNIDFVTKNIELAKCGMGVLSTTDEEKERLEHLLSDSSTIDSGENMEDSSDTSWKADLSSQLSRIDEQLEALSKASTSGEHQTSDSSVVNDRIADESKRGTDGGPLEKGGKTTDKIRLKQIDKLLNALK